MPLFKNTQTGDFATAHGATVGFLEQQGEGVWEEVDLIDAGELKGKALDDALKANDLPTSGTADEKRARLAEHLANEKNTAGAEGAPLVPEGTPDPSQGQ